MDARTFALRVLREIEMKDAYADVALDRALGQVTLPDVERRLATELVYGTVRRKRTLDTLIEQLATRPAQKQHITVRILVRWGLYQLRYLDSIPAPAAVHTTVELARTSGQERAGGFINGVLRNYLRKAEKGDPLQLPDDPIDRLAVLHSYPTWMVKRWVQQVGLKEAEALCIALNETPSLDFRVNVLRATVGQVQAAMQAEGVMVEPLAPLPTALRLVGRGKPIENLPGYHEGWWSVQDGSAQLVTHLLDPQTGETVIDACAAPGGKSIHSAELMRDTGVVWACDRTASRLQIVVKNVARTGVQSVRVHEGDSRDQPQFHGSADRVLLDAPCSNLGTLHRHADARWRQSPESEKELVALQQQLLEEAATWVKPTGVLVYSTCTLNPAENELQVQAFLARHPDWRIVPPASDSPVVAFATAEGWATVYPHQHKMDGFFMVKLERTDT